MKEIKRYNVEIDYDYNGDCPHMNDYVYKTGSWCKSDDVLVLELELIEVEEKHADHKAVVETMQNKIDDLLLIANHRWSELKKAEKRIDELEAETEELNNFFSQQLNKLIY